MVMELKCFSINYKEACNDLFTSFYMGLTFQFMCLLLSELPERTIAFGHIFRKKVEDFSCNTVEVGEKTHFP